LGVTDFLRTTKTNLLLQSFNYRPFGQQTNEHFAQTRSMKMNVNSSHPVPRTKQKLDLIKPNGLKRDASPV